MPVTEFRPAFAEHVRAEHEPRAHDPETGEALPMKFAFACERCGERYEGVCDSGRVRDRASKWALLHLHRDPLAPPARGDVPTPR